MAACSSNRSPSPMSTRPSPNLKPRNNPEPETSGIRKSFTGSPLVKVIPHSQHRSFNPNTPLNSSADYGRGHSFNKESGVSRQNFEQKENERDPNSRPVRVRSSSVSKATKNFMAPTISAASKTMPSPRKKVLAERNESVRTSASLSDGKFRFFSLNSPDHDAEKTEPVWEVDKQVQQSQHRVPASARAKSLDEKGDEFSAKKSEKVVRFATACIEIEPEPDLVVMSPDLPLHPSESSSTLHPSEFSSTLLETPKPVVAYADVALDVSRVPHSSPPLSAPLDNDPSLQPYDPMKNYLSPRPQFLHYKSKPRAELYINSDEQLEESLTSYDSSDNESSEEVVVNLQKDFEDTSSADMEDDEVAKTQACELLAATTVNNVPQGNVESKIVHTKRFITSLKAIALVLVTSAICLPLLAMHYPVIGGTLSRYRIIIPEKNHYSVQFYNLTAMDNEENFLVRPAQQYNLPSIYDNEVMIEVHENLQIVKQAKEIEVDERSVEEIEENFDFLPQVNFVSEQNHVHSIDQFPGSIVEDLEQADLVGSAILESEQTQEKNDLPFSQDQKTEDKFETREQATPSQISEARAEFFAEELSDETVRTCNNMVSSEHTKERMSFDAQDKRPEDDVGIMEQSSQSPEARSEVFAEELPDDPVRSCNSIDPSEAEAKVSHKNHQVPYAVTSVPDFLDVSQRMCGVCLAVVFVLVSLALMYRRLKKRSVAAAADAQEMDKLQAHKSVSKAANTEMEPSVSHRSPPCSGPVVVDMVGESCPSEMSSFRRCSSSYYNDNKRGETSTSMNEAESRGKKQRRNHKRESLASSDFSMGSPSYGSFTSYSIVHTKQGDEELVTPIRRSSRIRNQVTSL